MNALSNTIRITTLSVTAIALTVFSADTALASGHESIKIHTPSAKVEINKSGHNKKIYIATTHSHKPKEVKKDDCDHKPVVKPSPTPKPIVNPTPAPTPTPTPVAGKGSGQVLSNTTAVAAPAPVPVQAQPAALPQTGAGDMLGLLAGLGGLTTASVAYIRSRKRK